MTSQSDIYTIKEYNGHIGVFLNDETQPYKRVNVPLSALPAEDQELLKKVLQQILKARSNYSGRLYQLTCL